MATVNPYKTETMSMSKEKVDRWLNATAHPLSPSQQNCMMITALHGTVHVLARSIASCISLTDLNTSTVLNVSLHVM